MVQRRTRFQNHRRPDHMSTHPSDQFQVSLQAEPFSTLRIPGVAHVRLPVQRVRGVHVEPVVHAGRGRENGIGKPRQEQHRNQHRYEPPHRPVEPRVHLSPCPWGIGRQRHAPQHPDLQVEFEHRVHPPHVALEPDDLHRDQQETSPRRHRQRKHALYRRIPIEQRHKESGEDRDAEQPRLHAHQRHPKADGQGRNQKRCGIFTHNCWQAARPFKPRQLRPQHHHHGEDEKSPHRQELRQLRELPLPELDSSVSRGIVPDERKEQESAQSRKPDCAPDHIQPSVVIEPFAPFHVKSKPHHSQQKIRRVIPGVHRPESADGKG